MKVLFPLVVLLAVLAFLFVRGGTPSGVPGGQALVAEAPGAGSERNPDLVPAGVDVLEDGLEPARERTSAAKEAAATAPDTVSAASTGRGSMRVLVQGAEAAAVPQVPVTVARADGTEHDTGVRRVRTGDDGRVLIGGLVPGKYSVRCALGGSKRVHVAADSEAEVVLTIDELVAVRGRVVDARGDAVPAAAIYVLDWRIDWLGSERVTECDARGAFALPVVSRRLSLGATAPGHGPSAPFDLELVSAQTSPIEVRLELGAEGAALQGRVLDSGGEAVVGALVAAGTSPSEYEMRLDGTREEAWNPRVAVTDEEGRFAFEGLPTGTLPLVATHAEFAELREEVELTAGGRISRDLVLQRGLFVRGVVTVVEASPVEGALVLRLDAPFKDPFPTQGPTDGGAPFARQRTRTNANGEYRIGPLPAGDVHLYAAKGTTYWDDDVEFAGAIQASFEGKNGDTLEWSPRLDPGRRIHGRVTFADGTPMQWTFVSAFRDDMANRLTVHTETDGTFSIPGLEEQPYKIHVQLFDIPEGAESLDREDVWPSEEELLLVASWSKASELDEGHVSVRVIDDAKRLAGTGQVVFSHGTGWYHSEEKDGVHETDLPPGRYRPIVLSGDVQVGAGDEFDLAPGETRDLPPIHTRGAGTLRVSIDRRGIAGELFVRTERADGLMNSHETVPPESSEVLFEEQFAGELTLVVQGSACARITRRTTITADEPTELTLHLTPAVARTIRLTVAAPTDWGKIDVTIRDSKGEEYHSASYQERWSGPLPLDTHWTLPVGHFTFEARSSSGLEAHADLEVTSLEEAPPIELELHRP